MKQKYKVFINDQEIAFQQKDLSDANDPNVLTTAFSAEELYSGIKTHSLPNSDLQVITNHPKKDFDQFISHFHLIEAAGGIVRKGVSDGEILMIFRYGKWDLPKGKIDHGEDSENAAVREVEEECGIDLLKISGKAADTYHIYEYKGLYVVKRTYWYHMITNGYRIPVPQTSEGIEEVKWVTKKQLTALLPKCYRSIGSLLQNTVLNS